LSAERDSRGMEQSATSVARLESDARTAALVDEIVRYLDAVDTFRELGHEPHWRPDGPSAVAARITGWLDTRGSHVSAV
jgi:hypothetical protein